MGGQACILYGAAEFSRDIDFAVLSDGENFARLQAALDELQAERIAVPPFDRVYLDLGLAVHFRCRHPEATGLRVDIMSKMRGLEGFDELWSRRSSLPHLGETIDLLSLPDLVQAKKTQRDKDWPMISRLVEVDYFHNVAAPSPARIEFWLRELRTPSLLIEAARRYSVDCDVLTAQRPLLRLAQQGLEQELRIALAVEEQTERDADRAYWQPLRQQLEELRRQARA